MQPVLVCIRGLFFLCFFPNETRECPTVYIYIIKKKLRAKREKKTICCNYRSIQAALPDG
jgi:hypothetical protein